MSATQVRDAGLADWRQILGRIKARFRTGDFRTGLALVNKIGAEAEAAGHHPDIQLTYPDQRRSRWTHRIAAVSACVPSSARVTSRPPGGERGGRSRRSPWRRGLRRL
ncbi:MAG: 4a-hydroxytetrahydrobiopterin dehydratase [Nocardioidaceae bacterium]